MSAFSGTFLGMALRDLGLVSSKGTPNVSCKTKASSNQQ
jgi:hypothetical protein